MKKPWILTRTNRARVVSASLLTILLGIVLTIPARASVVFTNFGTAICGGVSLCITYDGINQNDEQVAGTAQTFEPTNPLETQSLAAGFTSGGNFTFTDVTLPLDNIGYGNADVYLMNSSGGAPGTVLESWQNVIGAPFATPPAAQTTITLDASGPSVTLSSGDNYWLVVTPATSTSTVFWNYNWFGVNTPGTLYNPDATNSGPWYANVAENAFEIDGTAISSGPPPPTVPEPSMFWFLGTGLIGVAIFRRRVKSAPSTA